MISPTTHPSPRTALVAACLLAIACLLAGCSGTPTEEPDTTAPATSPSAEEGTPTDSSAGEADDDVAYEPAYPADVSSEQLDESDVEQQEAAHSHGEEGDHDHGDGGDHDHGDGADHDHDA